MRKRYPRYESHASFERHRKEHTHEGRKPLYRGRGTRERELHQFEARYGKEKGRRVYGATVGKVYREKYGYSYRGGKYPEGRKGMERPSVRHHHRAWR